MIGLLRGLIDAPARPMRKPVFLLHGWSIELDAGLLARLDSAGVPRAWPLDHVRQRLDEAVAALGGPAFDPDKISKDATAALIAAVHIAAVCGTVRHPPLPDLPPAAA